MNALTMNPGKSPTVIFGGARKLIAILLAAWSLMATSALAKPPAGPKPTEVMVIAAEPFISDNVDGYTPAHLRALLKKFDPAVIIVEAPLNQLDPWSYAPLDVTAVVRPWGMSQRASVVPGGWYQADYADRVADMIAKIKSTGDGTPGAKRLADNEAALAAVTKDIRDIDAVNGPALREAWRKYQTTLHELYGRDTPWELWNSQIVKNLQTICKNNAGKRIAIVFSPAHAYYLYDALRADTSLTMMEVANVLPLEPAQVEAAVTPLDYLLALRPLDSETLDEAAIEQMGARIEGLQAVLENLHKRRDEARFPSEIPKLDADLQIERDVVLMQGKLLFHQGKYDEALQQFEIVAGMDESALSHFDNTTKLYEAGLLNAALTQRKLGREAEATKDLQAILAIKDLSPLTRAQVEMLLKPSPK